MVNLFFFGLLVAIVLGVFLWQLQLVDRSLQHNALERSQLVAGIIEGNLRNAELAADTIDEIISGFLDEKAHFIDYLDAIEPLHTKELTALAGQTNLFGITLVRPSGEIVSNPDHWLKKLPTCTTVTGNIQYDKKRKISYLVHPANHAAGYLSCVIIGIDATRILKLQKKTSLPELLTTLSSLPGINYIRISAERYKSKANTTSVQLLNQDDMVSAETRISMPTGTLVVGLDATNFIHRRERLRRQFIFFSCLLTGIGLIFSWFLYRYQKQDLERTRRFEQMMAKERESASLGRATATIAHEVRNPLNAINMGLQRLQMEAKTLQTEERELIDAMLEAVSRTSTIVTELQRFTQEISPRLSPLQLQDIVWQQLSLYSNICREQGIQLTSEFQDKGWVNGDPELLSEVVENLLKNSIESQPDGGEITLRLHQHNGEVVLLITNLGFAMEAEEIHRLGSPYFTTKIRGNGLGLPLSRRIVEAHGGTMSIEPDIVGQRFTIQVLLPVLQEQSEENNEHSNR